MVKDACSIRPIRARNTYDSTYSYNPGYNGLEPDSFVLSELNKIHQEPSRILVLEPGSGTGRNLFPIVQKGYNFIGCEDSRAGVDYIEQEVRKKHLSKRVKILKQNVLAPMDIGKTKADFAFMSHISQHFDSDGLRKIFQNMAKNLKIGGEFVFDALMRIEKNYSEYDNIIIPESGHQIKLTEYGAASFGDNDILKIAASEGFQFVSKKSFTETGLSRAKYETQKLWGGNNPGRFSKKPVKLMWYVFKKV